MGNFRRTHPRHKATAREHSSEWRYPEIEKGNSERGHVSTKRRASLFKERVEEYLNDVGRKIPYRR